MALRVAGVALAVLMVATASAVAGNRHGPITFEGTCELSGLLRQDPPITNVPQPGSATARAAGTCSGTLTGSRGVVRGLDSARSRYFARASGNVSCGGGSAAGSGVLRIADRRIAFEFSEVRGPGTAAVELKGRTGGSATGTANVSPDEDPVEIAQKCGGEGLSSAHIDIKLATTPAISG
jgi:hypothetical protein